MELLKQMAQQSIKATTQHVDVQESSVRTDDDVVATAILKAKHKLKIDEATDDKSTEVTAPSDDHSDKGMYGGRQVEFKQDVYRIPDAPNGDVSQPVGLLTQHDLNNYILFKKGDRLTFKWTGGTSGQAIYDVTRNGDVGIDANIEWTDPLIRELEDEGAITLMSA